MKQLNIKIQTTPDKQEHKWTTHQLCDMWNIQIGLYKIHTFL
jgi:hypothetical protein